MFETPERVEVISTRINVIYYQDEAERLKQFNVYEYEKVKMNEASEILENEGIPHLRVIKVLLEPITLAIPRSEIEGYLIDNEA